MRILNLPSSALLILSLAAVSFAQDAPRATVVPKLVRFSGSVRPTGGGLNTGFTSASVESMTLAVYRDQTGGTPIWLEVQNVAVDSDGHYSLLLGETANEGMPVNLFSSGEPRWLGVQLNRSGESEQPRVLMVSVPYALKASDAETLGGKPASAYLLAGATTGTTTATGSTTAATTTTPTANVTTPVKPRVNSGTPGFIGVFTNSTDLGNSVIQQGNGSVGVGTFPGASASTVPSLDLRTNPFSQIGMAQTTDYLTFFASDQFGPAIYWNPGKDLKFGKGGSGLYNAFGFVEQMRIQSSTGNVGIGTSTPASKLDVTGDINFTGNVKFAGSTVLQIPGGAANFNTGLGIGSLQGNSTGGNTVVGASALPAGTGGSNTVIGAFAMQNTTSAGTNTAVGISALQNLLTGTNNVAIGAQAGLNLNSANVNNIYIGNLGVASDNNIIRIGNKNVQTEFFAAGVRGVTTASNDAIPVVIDSNGQLGTVSSSRRFKEDIQDMGESSLDLMRLRPVTYRYKQPFADGSKPVQYGLIAEEVAEVYPDLVAHSSDGTIETVKYQVLDTMLLNEVQRQQTEIGAQKDQLRRMEQQLNDEHQQNQSLLERLSKLEKAISASSPVVR